MDEKLRRSIQLSLDRHEVVEEAKRETSIDFIESVIKKEPDIKMLELATRFSKENEKRLDLFVPQIIEEPHKKNSEVEL